MKISPSDVDRALAIAAFMAPDSDALRYVVIDGDPSSKARPRFTKTGRTYTPQRSKDGERLIQNHLRLVFPEPWTGNVAVGCVFFRRTRQRIDADNMVKQVCDAATGIVWHDDSQATGVLGLIELDTERPRTLVVFTEHASTMTRGTDETYPCKTCGAACAPRPDRRRPSWCSTCSAARRGHALAEPVPCAACGRPFRRRTKTNRYCSPACAVEGKRRPRRARQLSRCSSCNKELSHNRGGRCRDCWRADPLHQGGAR